MIEELTPQLLMGTLFLSIVVVPVVTLCLSAALLHRYRGAVRRAMAEAVGFHQGAAISPQARAISETPPAPKEQQTALCAQGLRLWLTRAAWLGVGRYLLAGLSLALVFSGAAHFVYPHGFGAVGFLIAVWIYLWPAFLAAPLIVLMGQPQWMVWFVGYFLFYAVLGLWAATIPDLPGYRFGAVTIPPRSSVTPAGMARLWLIVNGPPTVLMLLCLNRWIRAVAPLILALVTAMVSGLLAGYLAVFSTTGADAAVAMAVALGIHIYWLLLLALLLALLVFAAAGWWLMTRIAQRHRRRDLSDQSLLLDALWLLFASTYGMWLVSGGIGWIATVPAGFLVYKLTLGITAGRFSRKPPRPLGLTFLRVFSLGRRSEVLFEAVAKTWRHVGSIQLITGPDSAMRTVQPNQFLDFLSGRLRRHFVRDDASLERSLALLDRQADPDGRFRVNGFFCHADSWKAVLPRLVQSGDTVLMDLRSFSPENSGCAHELEFLVSEVPYRNCLLVVDETTDQAFLDNTLRRAAGALHDGSPNYLRPVTEMPRLSLQSGARGLAPLLGRLCESAAYRTD